MQVAIIASVGEEISTSPIDSRLSFGGRWYKNVENDKTSMKADWPCSDIKFQVDVEESGAKLPLIWSGTRTRVSVRKEHNLNPAYNKYDIFEIGEIQTTSKSDIIFEFTGRYSVTIRKLTTSAPYGNGLLKIFESFFEFLGFGQHTGIVLLTDSPRNRKIVAIGASDTAGSCIDGDPNKSEIELLPTLWKYDNCDSTYVANLGRMFDADISVHAIAGAGVTRNAFHSDPNKMGTTLLSEYFKLTLQLDSNFVWNFTQESYVDLVIVSLGGNDFNNQGGNVPSKEEFTNKYLDFLSFLFDAYNKQFNETVRNETQIVLVCGMGDPLEHSRDPDNKRCISCPFVEETVIAFKQTNEAIASRVHYKFVPCNGSVVTGIDDLSCGGHKNYLGQSKVSDFLAPYLSTITGWQIKAQPTTPPKSCSTRLCILHTFLLMISFCALSFIIW